MAKTANPSIGSMNKKIMFQMPSRADDGGGGHVDTWVTQFPFFAAVFIPTLQSGAKEIKEADKYRQESQYIFRTRYNAEIVKEGRLIYAGRAMKILTAIPLDEERRFMSISCADRGPAS